MVKYLARKIMSQKLKFIFELSSLYTKVFKAIDRRLSIHGITFSEFFVMYQLAMSSTKTMRRIDLAESVGMSASGVTRLLNPMEKLKIVEKEANARDARVSLVKLSDAGSTLFDDALKSVTETAEELLGVLDIDGIEAFLNIANKIK
jgi:DNA-binding MarR family transcriptional regulator